MTFSAQLRNKPDVLRVLNKDFQQALDEIKSAGGKIEAFNVKPGGYEIEIFWSDKQQTPLVSQASILGKKKQ